MPESTHTIRSAAAYALFAGQHAGKGDTTARARIGAAVVEMNHIRDDLHMPATAALWAVRELILRYNTPNTKDPAGALDLLGTASSSIEHGLSENTLAADDAALALQIVNLADPRLPWPEAETRLREWLDTVDDAEIDADRFTHTAIELIAVLGHRADETITTIIHELQTREEFPA